MHKTTSLPSWRSSLCAALAAPAQANFKVGIGRPGRRHVRQPELPGAEDQARPLPRARTTGTSIAARTREVDGFMDRAQRGRRRRARALHRPPRLLHQRPLLAAQGLPRAERARPTSRRSSASARRTRSCKTLGVWNEANHVSQPIGQQPEARRAVLPGRAQGLPLAARSSPPTCSTSATWSSWLRGFQRNAKGKAAIYGLHNYPTSTASARPARADAAHRRRPGLADRDRRDPEVPAELPALRDAPGEPHEVHVQARRPLRHAPRGLRSRITRLYNYQWTGVPPERPLRRRPGEPERLASARRTSSSRSSPRRKPR